MQVNANIVTPRMLLSYGIVPHASHQRFFSCLSNVFHCYYETECVGQLIPCKYIISQLWGELYHLSGVAGSFLLSNFLLHTLVEI